MSARPTGTVRYENAGRAILVSGGAQGIGLAVCTAYHASGASVLCFDIDDASFVTGTDLQVDGGLGALGAFAEPYPNESE